MIATESMKVTSSIVTEKPTTQNLIATTRNNQDDYVTKETQDDPTSSTLQLPEVTTDLESSTQGTQINPTMVECPVSTVTKTVTLTVISPTPIKS